MAKMQEGDQKRRAYSIPSGLKELLEDMSCEAIRKQPKDEELYGFFADYLEKRLGMRERGEVFVREFLADKTDAPAGDAQGFKSKGQVKGQLGVPPGEVPSTKRFGGGPYSKMELARALTATAQQQEQQEQQELLNREKIPVDTAVQKPGQTTARDHVDHVLNEALELINTLEDLDYDNYDTDSEQYILNKSAISQAAQSEGRNGAAAQPRRPSYSALPPEDRAIVNEILELKEQVNILKNHLDEIMGKPRTAVAAVGSGTGRRSKDDAVVYIDPSTGQRVRRTQSLQQGESQIQGQPLDPARPPRQSQSSPQAGGEALVSGAPPAGKPPVPPSAEVVESVYGLGTLPSVASFADAMTDMTDRVGDFWRENVEGGAPTEWANGVREFSTVQIHIVKQVLTGEIKLSDAPAQTAFLAISLLIGLVLGYSALRSLGQSNNGRRDVIYTGLLLPQPTRKCPI